MLYLCTYSLIILLGTANDGATWLWSTNDGKSYDGNGNGNGNSNDDGKLLRLQWSCFHVEPRSFSTLFILKLIFRKQQPMMGQPGYGQQQMGFGQQQQQPQQFGFSQQQQQKPNQQSNSLLFWRVNILFFCWLNCAWCTDLYLIVYNRPNCN